MLRIISSLLALLGFTTGYAASDSEYPYSDPLLATVSSALIRPRGAPRVQLQLKLRDDRNQIPWLEGRGHYGISFYPASRGDASLVVLLPGLGSSHADSRTAYLAEIFLGAGHPVLVLNSSLHWSHALAASQDGYTGYSPDDAKDLHAALSSALKRLREDRGLRFRSISLVGFSLGALNAAHLARLDSQIREFQFKQIVLINPPIDVLHGLRALDAMFMTGAAWPSERQDRLLSDAFGFVTRAHSVSDGNGREFRDLDRISPFSPEELKFLIGVTFRESLRDLILVSQQIDDRGVLKHPSDRWRREPRRMEAFGFSYEDYLRLFLLPVWTERQSRRSNIDEMNRMTSLTGVEDFLRTESNLILFHNADDFLLREQDTGYLRGLLGKRLRLYTDGGHGGNLWFSGFQKDLINIIQ